jgi:DNA-binding MarR family transcriptional regulator
LRRLDLDDFLPYRLSVLANTVSRALARLYQQRFGLSIPEWRVIAILGSASGLTSLQLAERSAMDKVAVSRAVARLTRRELIAAAGDEADRRRRKLSLTPKGMTIYGEVAPLALDYEQGLLARMGERDRESLDRMLRDMQARAQELLDARGR